MVYGGLKKYFLPQHMLVVCFHVFSFSLSSANMGSFPETQNDPTLRLITVGRAKNDAGMPVKQGHPT